MSSSQSRWDTCCSATDSWVASCMPRNGWNPVVGDPQDHNCLFFGALALFYFCWTWFFCLFIYLCTYFGDFPLQVWCSHPALISIWLPSVTSSSTPNITRELVSGLTYTNTHTHTHDHKSMHEDANTLTACICGEACFLPAANPPHPPNPLHFHE